MSATAEVNRAGATASQRASVRPTQTGEAPSLLVAIASYGRKQDHYLEQVIAQYRELTVACRIVVLSEASKPVNGAEVLVGLPSSNTYSLPFAHRKLFAENADNYDLFIYTEDDTLLTAVQLNAVLDLQRFLHDDEILGFLRSEISPAGERYITSINHFFRWLPESAETRGGELFAQFSNHHSGCFIATRAQLKRALASGGFLVQPHDQMYGMLESAASDIYTQCGLRRVICVSRIHELIVPHLPNKYFTEMGIPIEELDRQVLALSDVHNQGGWRGALYEPQTRASRFRWSKDLYEKPDEALVRAVPPGTRRLLSVGVGAGQAEQLLSKRGVDVHVLAIDPVFAGALRAKGIMAVAGPFSEALERLGPRPFDVVMVADVLHLVPDPVEWLRQLHEKLTPGGLLVVSVPNTGELTCWMKDLRDGRRRLRFPRYESTGVQPVSLRRLRGWCRESHFKYLDATPVVEEPKRRKLGRLAVGPVERLLADKFVLRATRTA